MEQKTSECIVSLSNSNDVIALGPKHYIRYSIDADHLYCICLETKKQTILTVPGEKIKSASLTDKKIVVDLYGNKFSIFDEATYAHIKTLDIGTSESIYKNVADGRIFEDRLNDIGVWDIDTSKCLGSLSGDISRLSTVIAHNGEWITGDCKLLADIPSPF